MSARLFGKITIRWSNSVTIVNKILCGLVPNLVFVGVDRKVLADKLAAIIALARYRTATQEWREMLKRDLKFKVSEAFLKSLKQLSALVRQVLQVDPDKVEMGSDAFPYRVELKEMR